MCKRFCTLSVHFQPPPCHELGRTDVRQDLGQLRRAVGGEALLDGPQSHVANVAAADPAIDVNPPKKRYPGVGIDEDGGPEGVAVPAGERKAIGPQRRLERIMTTVQSWVRSGSSIPEHSTGNPVFFMIRQADVTVPAKTQTYPKA